MNRTTEELLAEAQNDDGKPVGVDRDEEEIQPYEGATEVDDPGGVARPVCGATNDVLGLTCDRPPHPAGTTHYQDDGNGVRAWPDPSSDLPKGEDE